MKLNHALKLAAAICLLGLPAVLTNCEERPRTLGEKVDDALDNRPHEKAKDAAEDLKDAAHDAKNALKDAVKK